MMDPPTLDCWLAGIQQEMEAMTNTPQKRAAVLALLVHQGVHHAVATMALDVFIGRHPLVAE